MRHTSFLVVLCLVVAVFSLLTSATHPTDRADVDFEHRLDGPFVPNEILVGLETDAVPSIADGEVSPFQTGVASLDRLNRKYAVQEMSPVFTQLDPGDPIAARYGLTAVFRLTAAAGTDIFAMIAEYRTVSVVAYAEPNRIYHATDIPSDADFKKQWALNNTGQTGGTVDADIDAPEAWDIEKGEPTVLIAIVDTGVDYGHPDLSGGKVRTDIDRDFINSDDDARDDHGHGTYCAGLAAASSNNARGIAGVCRGCRILPVKVLNSIGLGTAETVAQGIQYAAQAGAKIISMSLGYSSDCGCSQTVARAINYAFESGSLLIAASGNDADKARLSYPASSPRVMSVGASDHHDQQAEFSNESRALNIMAPGVDVYSLDLSGGYEWADGTSAAAPHVAGAAGLVWSHQPALSNAEVWWILWRSADAPIMPVEENPPLNRPYRVYFPIVSKAGFGRLNVNMALRTLAIGRFGAPEDKCDQEPDSPPECSAEIVLSGEATAHDDLRLLRTLRDEVLAHSPIGQRWIALYEQHRMETAVILISDGQLRAEVRLALSQWLPLFRVLIYQDPVADQQAIISPSQAQALESVITGLADQGSAQLGSDLANVRRTLQVERFVGWDVRDAWRELNAEN